MRTRVTIALRRTRVGSSLSSLRCISSLTVTLPLRPSLPTSKGCSGVPSSPTATACITSTIGTMAALLLLWLSCTSVTFSTKLGSRTPWVSTVGAAAGDCPPCRRACSASATASKCSTGTLGRCMAMLLVGCSDVSRSEFSSESSTSGCCDSMPLAPGGGGIGGGGDRLFCDAAFVTGSVVCFLAAAEGGGAFLLTLATAALALPLGGGGVGALGATFMATGAGTRSSSLSSPSSSS